VATIGGDDSRAAIAVVGPRLRCSPPLWSRHLDADALGGCAAVRVNRVAGDDNPLALTRIAVRPLAQPAFPLDALGRL